MSNYEQEAVSLNQMSIGMLNERIAECKKRIEDLEKQFSNHWTETRQQEENNE